MLSLVRHPAVAGTFYPGDAGKLSASLTSYLSPRIAELPAIGCVAPHAGYMYSGAVAGAVFSSVEVSKRVIVLCPNHTGMGVPFSIMSRGAWETPLGSIAIDDNLAEALKQRFPLLKEDTAAHRSEHAIEVELPFLQAKNPAFQLVPIALGSREFHHLEMLGEAIAQVISLQKTRVLIVASSDMNHYENDAVTRVKDHKAIERILALDARGLFDVVTREEISMCGFGPTVVMLTAAKKLGAKSAELVRYATSGEVSGDHDMVVGYAGIAVR